MGGIIFGVTNKMSLIVLIGPSGAGKSTAANLLVTHYGFRLQKTITTRPKRDDRDIDHIFVNEETFQEMAAQNMFFGTIHSFGHDYGLPKFDHAERTVLLLRAAAVKEFRTRFPDAMIIEIDAPIEILVSRLIVRDSLNRVDTESLAQEIALGRSLATATFDSSKLSAEDIARSIADLA